MNSPQARRRRLVRLFKGVGLLLLGGALVSGAVLGVRALKDRDEPIELNTPSSEIERLLFETDGVLPDSWLSQVIGLRRGMTMMEVDLRAMKAKLEAQPQVKVASVERVFPNALKIRLQEHEPVLRLAVSGPDGRTQQRIISRSGTVYEGVGYPKATLDRLPFADPYRHPDGGVTPIRGMDQVAELLAAARRKQPDFFRTWRVVSLRHFSGDDDLPAQVIEIRSTRIERVLFSASKDFELQLDRLQVIFDFLAQRSDPSVKRVDLSLRGSAAVQFSSGRISSF
ncbi:MAG: cell division protein FtsQ/DivIB [Opitutales bacterium]